MIKISQINIPLSRGLSKEDIAKKLHCSPSDIKDYQIIRKSLDGRHHELHFSYSVAASVKNQEKCLRLRDVAEYDMRPYELPKATKTCRPIVAGFGPAGMFSAMILAEAGLCPLVIERGKPCQERAKDVEAFFTKGILDTESNVQYGEGGAGTFSDGKLTTRIKDFRIHKVLQEFIEAGASESIAYEARPHLGTDALQQIVVNIRNKIISLGGTVLFNTRLESIIAQDDCVKGIVTSNGTYDCDSLVLALGHSAADTYRALHDQNVFISAKDFAAGIRVEHPQEMINRCQYGEYYDHPALLAASYTLKHQARNKRGVYSFCMCPGGIVIPASTQVETLAVNGMSYASRSGKNANAAILVQIPKSDFLRDTPLDGFAYQHMLETNAYRLGYKAPSQNIFDYLKKQSSSSLAIASSYPRGNEFFDMHRLFEAEVNDALSEGFEAFDKMIPGFIAQGIMVGMESRSSSPIRIDRNDSGQSLNIKGLYPCGEGAGYAGGIVSSAVDGIRQAEHLIRNI